MIWVKSGDVVVLRDGRIVDVTDAASSDPLNYQWYDEVTEELNDELPRETIFVGRSHDGTVVSDMSEVIAIVN